MEGADVARALDPSRGHAVCRDSEDGKVRAFHNVCAHRANIVEHRPSGNAKRFVCRYHSWGYRR